MTLVAILGNELRELIKYGPEGNPKRKGESPEDSVFHAMERAGFLGVEQFAVDAAYAHRFGSSGLSQVLGPQAGQLEQVVRGIGKAAEDRPRRLAREVASAIPIANAIPGVRRGIADRLALPGQK